MYYTIYKVTNQINNKFYIGMHRTEDLDDEYMGSGKLIRRAIKKYGIKNFKKDILYIFDNEKDMENKEKELVVISEMSYNLCDGGKGGFGYINKNVDRYREIRKQNGILSKTKKVGIFDKKRSLFWENERIKKSIKTQKKLKIGIFNPELPPSFLGKKHKEETKKLIGQKNSISQKGSKNSQYGTFWITNGIKNIKTKGYIPEGDRKSTRLNSSH